jgi:hypothetical protein
MMVSIYNARKRGRNAVYLVRSPSYCSTYVLCFAILHAVNSASRSTCFYLGCCVPDTQKLPEFCYVGKIRSNFLPTFSMQLLSKVTG